MADFDWQSIVSAAAMIIAGAAAAYVKITTFRQANKRQDNADALAAFRESITFLQKERTDLKTELNDLKSKYTACLFEQSVLKGQCENCRERVLALENQLKQPAKKEA